MIMQAILFLLLLLLLLACSVSIWLPCIRRGKPGKDIYSLQEHELDAIIRDIESDGQDPLDDYNLVEDVQAAMQRLIEMEIRKPATMCGLCNQYREVAGMATRGDLSAAICAECHKKEYSDE